ncbi:hypothetical protein [Halostella sp. PRR32]|uniref:hypothetical protein n=1 Tax=Halostella sp. PRR32 TaxID=3098147 RepID=UPI002B1D28D3|nr:hypothetical protein [Halostella sp. PRR32]
MPAKHTSVRRDHSSRAVRTGAPVSSVGEIVRRANRALVGLFWAAVAALTVAGGVAVITSFEGAGAFAMVVGTAVLFVAIAAVPFVAVRAVVAALSRSQG